jgi:hypothetical protein
LVVVMALTGCTVDGRGIGQLVGDGGGGAGGTDGPGGAGGIRPDGPQPDTGPNGPDLAPEPDAPKQAFENGWPCTGTGACASGHCVDGFCCESPCNGVCVACSRGKTGRPDGQCRPIPSGLDPEEECAPESSACGRTGSCNGNGSCAVVAAGVACGASSCSGHVVVPPPRCNGAGTCDPQPARVCSGYLRCADGSVCKATCAGDGDCVAGSECDEGTGQCSVPRPLGSACNPGGNGSDCASGHCVDGVCCDTPCTGMCSACTQARTGVASGTCAPVSAGQDPDDECEDEGPSTCGQDGTCDGAGACRTYQDGTVCATECCGNGDRLCAYSCRLGDCDMSNRTMRDECGGNGGCCCDNPTAGGPAACLSAVTCAVGCSD